MTFKDDDLSQLIKTLYDNRAIRFVVGKNKVGDTIPYDFRIDRSCYGENITTLGEMLADKVIEIEHSLGVKFDSLFCSVFSGVFTGVSAVMWLQQKYNRNFKLSISRRSYQQKMGAETGTEKFLTSVHQMKNKTLVGELGSSVLVYDEMTNTGTTVKEMMNICRFNGVEPKACMLIADRILTPIQDGSHVRMYGDVPCYSFITHFELVDWCRNNLELWKSLRVEMYDNQNNFNEHDLVKFQETL